MRVSIDVFKTISEIITYDQHRLCRSSVKVKKQMLIKKYFLADWVHFFQTMREIILWFWPCICPACLHPLPISLEDFCSIGLIGISVHHHMHAGSAWSRESFFLLFFHNNCDLWSVLWFLVKARVGWEVLFD